jgi:acetolactate synthase small subunit
MSNAPWSLVGLHAAVRFTLVAEASPGVLPRVLAPFARRDLTPDTIESRRNPDGTLRIDITMARMPAEMVHLVAGNLRQIIEVQTLTHTQEVTGHARRAA